MSDRFRHASPMDARMPTPLSERMAKLEPLVESRRGPEGFRIGGVDVLGQRPPSEPKPEYKKLTRALLFSLMAHASGAYAVRWANGEQTGHEPARAKQTAEVQNILREGRERKELVETLEKERTVLIDRMIDVWLDPSSAEYHREEGPKIGDLPIPPVDAFISLDALNVQIRYAKHVPGQTPSVEEIHERVQHEQSREQQIYDERLERLLNDQSYVWTGNLETDLPTLREAMLTGPHRFFLSPTYSETKYQKDSWRLNDQLASGLVNCQISRMTPLLMEEIYGARGLDETPLLQLRTAAWGDHVQTAIVRPDGSTANFAELSLGEPVVEGLRSPGTGDAATILPIETHLGIYIAQSGATDEQKKRIESLLSHPASTPDKSMAPTRQTASKKNAGASRGEGGLDLGKSRYMASEIPSQVLPITSGGLGENLVITADDYVGENTETKYRSGRDMKGSAKGLMRDYLDDQIKHGGISVSGSGEVFYAEIPRWASSDILREHVINSIRTSSQWMYVVDTLSLKFIDVPEERERVIQQATDVFLSRQNGYSIFGQLYQLRFHKRWDLIVRIMQHEEFRREFQATLGREIQDDPEMHGTGLTLPFVLDILTSIRSRQDAPWLDVYIEQLEAHQSTRPELASALPTLSTDQLAFMTDEQIWQAFKNTPRGPMDSVIGGTLVGQEGRAEILFDRFQGDRDKMLELQDNLYFFPVQDRYLQWLETQLQQGWRPTKSKGGQPLTAGESMLSVNGAPFYDDAERAAEFPHVFDVFFRSYFPNSGASRQINEGVTKAINGHAFDGDMTIDDVLRIRIPHTIDDELVGTLQRIYLESDDQPKRITLLEEVRNTEVFPKSMLFEEDLALMGDVTKTQELTVLYRPETIHVSASQGFFNLEGLLNSNLREAERVLAEMDAIPEE